MTTPIRVARNSDNTAHPITGRVLGWEDEDRVLVVWGDAQYRPDGEVLDVARIEMISELYPVSGSWVRYGRVR
jgi:hypothetical protein